MVKFVVNIVHSVLFFWADSGRFKIGFSHCHHVPRMTRFIILNMRKFDFFFLKIDGKKGIITFPKINL